MFGSILRTPQLTGEGADERDADQKDEQHQDLKSQQTGLSMTFPQTLHHANTLSKDNDMAGARLWRCNMENVMMLFSIMLVMISFFMMIMMTISFSLMIISFSTFIRILFSMMTMITQ